MVSKAGEFVEFVNPVNTQGLSPEVWLKLLDKAMVLAMKQKIFNAYANMDLDMPKVPENDRDFKKFMQLKVSHER